MTLRTCYDSTTVADLPPGGDLYLGYVDGRYANVDAIRKRFPHRPVVRITVTGNTLDADMLDVEPGNVAATRDQACAKAAAWAKAKLQRGEFPVLYFMESWRPAIDGALKASGINPARVGHFPADYDGKATLNAPGDVGKQYKSPDGTGAGHVAGHYDVSVVRGYWPGVDPAPRPNPAGFSVGTRMAIIVATRQLNRRQQPLTVEAKARLVGLQRAIEHALNLK